MLRLAGKTPRSNKHSSRQPSNLSLKAGSSIPSRKAAPLPSPLESGKRRPCAEGPRGAARSWQRAPRHEPQVAARHSGTTGGRAAAPTRGPQEGLFHPRGSHDCPLFTHSRAYSFIFLSEQKMEFLSLFFIIVRKEAMPVSNRTYTVCAPGTSAPRSCCKTGTFSARSASPTSPSTQIGAGGTQGPTREGRPSPPSAVRVAPWAGTARPGGCLGTSRGPAGGGTSPARLGTTSCRAAPATLTTARIPRGAGRGASLPCGTRTGGDPAALSGRTESSERGARGPAEHSGRLRAQLWSRPALRAAHGRASPSLSRCQRCARAPPAAPTAHSKFPEIAAGCGARAAASPCRPFLPCRKQRSTFQPGSIPAQSEGSRAAAGGAHRARPARCPPERRESRRAAHARGPLTCLRRASGAGQAQP